MATAKEKKEQAAVITFVIGVLVLLPLLFISIIYYFMLKSKFPGNEDSQRIIDVGNLVQPIGLSSVVAIITWWLFALTNDSDSIVAVTLQVLIFVVVIFLAFKIAQSVSCTYFGVVIDSQNNRVLMPRDMANYRIPDYVALKFVRELGIIEQVPLDEIKRMTRQGGKFLFIHGRFGSRGMKFSSKQKRDECLSAIREASRAKESMEFEGA